MVESSAVYQASRQDDPDIRVSTVSSLSSDSGQPQPYSQRSEPNSVAYGGPQSPLQQRYPPQVKDPAAEPMLDSGSDQTPPLMAKQETEHHVEPIRRSPTKVSVAQGVKKNLGLTLLSTILRKGPAKPEEPKVAIQRGLLLALSGLLVHIVPVFACIALLYLNINGFYIGSELAGFRDQDSAKVNALQFVAKLHEVTMMSSLTVIIFTMLRRKLVSNIEVPFGALVSGFEFAQVQYLWSKELWGSFVPMAKACGWLYVFSLILATFIVPLIGPASALLMIPRLDDWPAGGTTFYLNATKDQIWPASVNAADVPEYCSALSQSGTYEERSCPAGGWEAIKSGYAGLAISDEENIIGDDSTRFFSGGGPFPLPGKIGLTTMLVSRRTTVTQFCISDVLLRVAQIWSTASEVQLRGLGRSFKYRKRARFFVEENVLQPWTGALCQPTTVAHNATSVEVLITSPVEGVLTSFLSFDLEPEMMDSQYPTVVFRDNPDGLHASTAAIVVLPRAAFGEVDSESSNNDTTIMGCSISSHWVDSKPDLTNERVYQRSWTSDNKYDFPEYYTYEEENNATPIKIDTDWANYLNPTIDSNNGTVFKELLQGSKATGTEADSPLVERLLSAMVTNGLARVGFSTFAQGVLPDLASPNWGNPIFPKRTFGSGGAIWNTDEVDTTNMFKAEVKVTVNGYGFWIESRTVLAAAVLLIIYCCFTLPHAVFVAISGVSYMCWDSITELTTLAIQSPKTATLRNTTAGVAGREVYKTPVKLRAVGDQVEILFEDTDNGHELVRPGVAYS